MGAKKSSSRVYLIEKAKGQRHDRPWYHWSDVRVAQERTLVKFRAERLTEENQRMEILGIIADMWEALGTAKPRSKPSAGVMEMKRLLGKYWGAGYLVEKVVGNRTNDEIMRDIHGTWEAFRQESVGLIKGEWVRTLDLIED